MTDKYSIQCKKLLIIPGHDEHPIVMKKGLNTFVIPQTSDKINFDTANEYFLVEERIIETNGAYDLTVLETNVVLEDEAAKIIEEYRRNGWEIDIPKKIKELLK